MAKKSFSLRLNEDLHNKIILLAKEENRSVNNQIFVILREFLEGYERENGEIDIIKLKKL